MKIYLLLLSVLLIPACGSTPEQSSVRYNFPQQSVIKDLPDYCIRPVSNPFKGIGKLFESAVMETLDITISPEEEQQYGEKIASAMSEKWIFGADDDAYAEKIQSILESMLPYRARKDIRFSIRLVEDDKNVNAWTHSGGYIYVTRALIDFTQSKDELAFVIAHELAHHENRHCDKTLLRIKAASETLGDEDLGAIAHNILSWVMSGFDQEQELEADLGALYLSYMAGFNPEKGPAFFTRLAEKETISEIGKMLNSHPYSKDREQCVRAYLRSARR